MSDVDPVRAFSDALTPAARHHIDLNYESIPLIHAASKYVPPAELAAICSAGIGWNSPANAHSLIMFRIRRESRLEEQESI